jgi:hypothetical protein
VKLENLPDGLPDCPLIRLYEFDQSEARLLRQLAKSLAAGEREVLALHDEEWIESVGGCSLNLRRRDRDQGVRATPFNIFECVLSAEGWRNVEALLEPLCESGPSRFQWLTRQGRIALLISPSGQW